MRNFIISNSLLLVSLIPAVIFPQYGEVTVKTWPGDKKSAYTFTFDDGLASQVLYGRRTLDEYGLKASLMVISGHLSETPPGPWRYTAWSVLRELDSEGYEIGSHSVNHHELTELPVGDSLTPGTAVYEIYNSRKTINQKLNSEKCFSFAYPLSVYNDTVQSITAQFYGAGRGDGYTANGNSLPDDEFMRLKGIPPLFDMPRNSLSDDLPELQLHKDLVSTSVQQGNWVVSMFHEIVPQSELPALINMGLWNPVSEEWFKLLCSWIKERSEAGDIWVATLRDAVKYIKERKTFASQVVYQSENHIRLNITDQLDNMVYNVPLTVDITVPPDWDMVRIVQGSVSSVVNSFQVSGTAYIRADLIPDNGEVVLLKQNTSGNLAISGTVKYYKSDSPVEDVLVIALSSDSLQASSFTDHNGYFFIPGLTPGSYSISLQKQGSFAGVNATDAYFIKKHSANQHNFEPIELLAADVDNSSAVDNADAEIVLKRFSRVIDRFEISDWLFYPPNPAVSLIDPGLELEIKAIKAGDVSPK